MDGYYWPLSREQCSCFGGILGLGTDVTASWCHFGSKRHDYRSHPGNLGIGLDTSEHAFCRVGVIPGIQAVVWGWTARRGAMWWCATRQRRDPISVADALAFTPRLNLATAACGLNKIDELCRRRNLRHRPLFADKTAAVDL